MVNLLANRVVLAVLVSLASATGTALATSYPHIHNAVCG